MKDEEIQEICSSTGKIENHGAWNHKSNCMNAVKAYKALQKLSDEIVRQRKVIEELREDHREDHFEGSPYCP